MASATDSSQANNNAAAEKRQQEQIPRWSFKERQDRWCHPRYIPGELMTEQHVVKFLEGRGVQVNNVKFEYQDECDYSSYGDCKDMLDRFAKMKLVHLEDDVRELTDRLWNKCGIYIK